eukprot:6472508-Amphidinium_carterae.1
MAMRKTEMVSLAGMPRQDLPEQAMDAPTYVRILGVEYALMSACWMAGGTPRRWATTLRCWCGKSSKAFSMSACEPAYG